MSGLIDQGGSQVIEGPPGGRTIVSVGRAAGQRDHIEPFRGGKASRSTRLRRILKTGQSFLDVAVSPGRDRMAITVELGGDLKVGGMVLVAGSENQPASESQGLWRGASPNQSFQLGALSERQRNSLRKRERHS